MTNEEKILEMLTEMNTRFNSIDSRLDSIDSRLERVENKQDEQGGIIQSILHNQEYANAEIEGLKSTTATATSVKEIREFQQNSSLEAIEYIHDKLATKEDLLQVENKLNVLNDDLFIQKAEIKGLKRIK